MRKKSKKPSQRVPDKSLLGPCGVYCGYCLAYKYERCDGCIAMSERAEKMGEVFCDIYPCWKEKKIVMCAECELYPCDKYDPHKASIFSESFVKWIRKEIKTKGPKRTA
ncbi:MAG TPA: DUF3795 domain-containing protein [Thermoplasmata archaeon]